MFDWGDWVGVCAGVGFVICLLVFGIDWISLAAWGVIGLLVIWVFLPVIILGALWWMFRKASGR